MPTSRQTASSSEGSWRSRLGIAASFRFVLSEEFLEASELYRITFDPRIDPPREIEVAIETLLGLFQFYLRDAPEDLLERLRRFVFHPITLGGESDPEKIMIFVTPLLQELQGGCRGARWTFNCKTLLNRPYKAKGLRLEKSIQRRLDGLQDLLRLRAALFDVCMRDSRQSCVRSFDHITLCLDDSELGF